MRPTPPNAAYHSIGLTVRVLFAIDHAEDAVGVPAIVPHPLGHPVLSGEFGKGPTSVVLGHVGMHGPGPLGRSAPVNG
jgi:hypothetical protein